MLSNRPAGRPATAADVVVVADRFPARGDPLVEFARALDGARVEAAARPESPDLELAGALHIDYREDDGIAARAVALIALIVRHPARSVADVLSRRAGEPVAVGAGAVGATAGARRPGAGARSRRQRDEGDRAPDRPAGRPAARRGASPALMLVRATGCRR